MKVKIYVNAFLLLILTISLQAQEESNYYFSKTIEATLDEASTKVKSAFMEQGFGSITEIDMHTKLSEKLKDVELKPYRILGMCNPGIAYKALQIEENIGLFLPCKVIIKDMGDGKIEVVVIDPSYLMQIIGDEELNAIGTEVTQSFKKALESL
jgi:uncharacterized protein (DUF302 family)